MLQTFLLYFRNNKIYCVIEYKMKFILAVSDDNKIAIEDRLPWKIRHDMLWFKMNTYGGTIVMGRKTWDSIGKKELKGRRNIVISQNNISDVETIHMLDQIPSDAYVIGGAQLCQQLWNKEDIIILTRVHCTVPNGLEIQLPQMKTLWEKTFEGYTFSLNKIIGS